MATLVDLEFMKRARDKSAQNEAELRVEWQINRRFSGCLDIVGRPLGMPAFMPLDQLLLSAVKTQYNPFDLSSSNDRLIKTMSLWGREIALALSEKRSAEFVSSATVYLVVKTVLRAVQVPFTTSRCDTTQHFVLQETPLADAAARYEVVLDEWHTIAFKALLTSAIATVNPIATMRFSIEPTRSLGYIHIASVH